MIFLAEKNANQMEREMIWQQRSGMELGQMCLSISLVTKFSMESYERRDLFLSLDILHIFTYTYLLNVSQGIPKNPSFKQGHSYWEGFCIPRFTKKREFPTIYVS